MKSILVSLLFLLMLGEFGAYSQSSLQKRIFLRSFGVNKESLLEVNNKYGDISITESGSDSLFIRAEVEASGPNEERIRSMYDGITINISVSGAVIRAHTDFDQSINSIIESFKGMTNKLIPYESKIRINYFIKAPVYLNIKIENKFGDIVLGDNSGDISCSLSNGSLTAGSLKEIRDMNLNLAEAVIRKVSQATIDASFSTIEIGESEDLSVSSVSCKLDLKKAGTLNTKSRSDKIFIGTIESVYGDSYFTDYRLGNLSGEINLASKFGGLHIDLVKKEAFLISLNSSSSDINLRFDQDMSYSVEIRHTNSFVVVPERNAEIEKEVVSEGKKEYLITGTVGKKPANTKVRIEAARGNIYLK